MRENRDRTREPGTIRPVVFKTRQGEGSLGPNDHKNRLPKFGSERFNG